MNKYTTRESINKQMTPTNTHVNIVVKPSCVLSGSGPICAWMCAPRLSDCDGGDGVVWSLIVVVIGDGVEVL